MKVTLTRDLGPHAKGTTHQVTPATGARLIRKGAAKDAAKAKADDGDEGDSKNSGATL